nr:hypothetical protein [Tanacetum cinerariifolium]
MTIHTHHSRFHVYISTYQFFLSLLKCAFIGTVFVTNTIGHLQKLKKIDPIDVEMAANEKPLHQLDQAAFEDH